MAINDQNLLSCVEICRDLPATKSIIWLHGLGADGNDFVPVAHELTSSQTESLRFVLPHAPIMPVAVNGGYEMRAWFDIYDLSFDGKIDNEGIQQSVHHVEKLIEREVAKHISTENIILAGFSQGAVIALTAALTYTKPLGGIIALSGFLPLAEDVIGRVTANQHIPIFIGHGTADPIVPFLLGDLSAKQLTKAGFSVSFHTYPMAHSVCAEEVGDIRTWLVKNKR